MSDSHIQDVFLFPPAGAGVQLVNTPSGPVVAPVPFNEYKNVKDVAIDRENDYISFTKRDGTRIISNCLFTMVETPRPTDEA